MQGYYRKKPVVVEAIKTDEATNEELTRFCGMNWGKADAHDMPMHDDEGIVVFDQLSEQWLAVPCGDWIIRGTKGELYPCDSSVFEEIYEQVEKGEK